MSDRNAHKTRQAERLGGLLVLALLGLIMTTEVSVVFAQGPPITTDTAFVNGLEGAAFRSFVFTVQREGLVQKGEDVIDPLQRGVSIYGLPLIFPYEVLSNRLVLALGVPILHKEMHVLGEGRRQIVSNSGLGDVFVRSKLLIFQRDRHGETTRAALTSRIKLPTGKTDATDADGNRVPPSLQLGTGSVDYALGGVVTHVRRRVGFNGELGYQFNTENDGFAFGDVLIYNFSIGYRL